MRLTHVARISILLVILSCPQAISFGDDAPPRRLYKISHGIYIDRNGNVALQVKYPTTARFSDGLAVMSLEAHGLRGYMDMSGSVVVPPKFSAADQFHGGLAAVQLPGSRKIGYCDRQGNIVIQPQFDICGSFEDGVALVGDLTFYGGLTLSLSGGDLGIPIQGCDFKYNYIDTAGRRLGDRDFNKDGLIDPDLICPILVQSR